jgi:hypothetical protein
MFQFDRLIINKVALKTFPEQEIAKLLALFHFVALADSLPMA